MDSRLCPTSFTQADPGDMFIMRNAGNVVPHNQLFGENQQSALSERAALELAISTGVKDIAVCGHSDCKVATQNNLWPTPTLGVFWEIPSGRCGYQF